MVLRRPLTALMVLRRPPDALRESLTSPGGRSWGDVWTHRRCWGDPQTHCCPPEGPAALPAPSGSLFSPRPRAISGSPAQRPQRPPRPRGRRTPSRPAGVTRRSPALRPPAGGSGAAVPTCARAERRGGAERRGRVLPQPGGAAGSAPAPAPEKLSVGAVRSAGARSWGRAAASAGAAAGAGPALWAAGGAGLCPPRLCPPRVHLRRAVRPSPAPPRCPPGRRRAAAKRADCGGPSAGCGAGGGRGGRGARRLRAPICAEKVGAGGSGRHRVSGPGGVRVALGVSGRWARRGWGGRAGGPGGADPEGSG